MWDVGHSGRTQQKTRWSVSERASEKVGHTHNRVMNTHLHYLHLNVGFEKHMEIGNTHLPLKNYNCKQQERDCLTNHQRQKLNTHRHCHMAYGEPRRLSLYKGPALSYICHLSYTYIHLSYTYIHDFTLI